MGLPFLPVLLQLGLHRHPFQHLDQVQWSFVAFAGLDLGHKGCFAEVVHIVVAELRIVLVVEEGSHRIEGFAAAFHIEVARVAYHIVVAQVAFRIEAAFVDYYSRH